MKNRKTVDLFCGCGGMSKGLSNAGFELVAAFDNWAPAVEVYRKNFEHPVFQHDLSAENTVEMIRKYSPNIIVGGPPCQDFSTAGLGIERHRANLTVTFAQIIADIKPEYFIMENVPAVRNSKVFSKAIEIYKAAGYGLTQKVLDASYCGVPQTRKRLFLIGHIASADGFLDKYLDAGLSSKPMSMYDYFGASLNTEYYFRVPTNYSRRGIFSIHEPCVTIRGIDRPIPKGYKGHPKDPVPLGDQVRALTVLERSYVQTFPKDFIFEGNKSDLNTMIGNAVPVNLASYVGAALIKYAGAHERQGDKNEGC